MSEKEVLNTEETKVQPKNVLVFGSSGFFGRHTVEELKKQGYNVYETYGRKRYDLLNLESTRSAFIDAIRDFENIDYVIHLAGFNGGLKFNELYPAEILENNIVMANNIVKAAKEFEVGRVVLINAVCAYPDKHRQAMKEDNYLDGSPDSSVEFHAYAKRHLVKLGDAYAKQYGLKFTHLCFTNLFGPECSFDPTKSKVVEAVIKKLVDAKNNNDPEVVFWGDGSPKREFMFVKDAAKYLVNNLDYDGFLNIGTGKNSSIKQLVEIVNKIVKYKGTITWDTDRQNGQSQRVLKIDKLLETLSAEGLQLTSFSKAIEETVNYYQNLDK